ncbi:hypothetical protein [Acetatifactor muris]|uniref:hypothetical protein n=1 Tax=Acetatifactor muris TaxID=879566 RepID=UPI0023F4F19A|nr:hypothetical protein [Acetatifactor muris]
MQIPDFNTAVLEETVLTLLNQELMRRGDQIRQRGALEQFQKEALEGLAGKGRAYWKE